MRTKKGDIEKEFDLNLGELVKIAAKKSGHSYMDISKMLNLTKEGFASKVRNPHYGDTYDIIKISLTLKEDFITPMLLAVRARGLKINKTYLEGDLQGIKQERDELEEKLKKKEREMDLAYDLIKELKEKVSK